MPSKNETLQFRPDPRMRIKSRLQEAATNHDRSMNWLMNHILDRALTPEFISGTEGKLW